MAGFLLDEYPSGTTIYAFWPSFNSAGASSAQTGLATTDIEIYKNGSTTQRASDNGYALLDTDGQDIDGITGINGISIDLSDNSDASFYAVGSQYSVIISTVTIDSQTVSIWLGTFRIKAAEHTAGYDVVTVKDGTGTGEIDTSSGLVTAILRDGAHGGTSASFAFGAGGTISNASGSALVLTSSGSNGSGLVATGNGTGSGGLFTSGSGATGNGISGVAASTDGHGISGAGSGSGSGLRGIGGTTGAGIRGTGGATSGAGIQGVGTAGNSPGFKTDGQGSGAGFITTGGATGHGMAIVGGGTSGDGLNVSVTSGDEIDANITGSIDSVVGLVPSRLDVDVSSRASQTSLDTVDDFLDTEIADIRNRLPAALTAGGNMKADMLAANGSTEAVTKIERALESEVLVTVGVGSTTTGIVASAISPASSVNDQFNGRVVLFPSDTATAALRGQGTRISDFDHATQTFTVTALTTAPSSGDIFIIV